ncbi:MAG: hypothetical protein Q8Q23_05370 [bacterium]|nr:hypothetical protein [bacterium]
MEKKLVLNHENNLMDYAIQEEWQRFFVPSQAEAEVVKFIVEVHGSDVWTKVRSWMQRSIIRGHEKLFSVVLVTYGPNGREKKRKKVRF